MIGKAAATPRGTVTGEARVVGPGFHARVYAKVREVPAGHVTTYGDVAGALGSRRVARQVGFALAALDPSTSPSVPWHRVINGRGQISYRGDVGRGSEQELRLQAEGIRFDELGRVIDFASLRHAFAAPDAQPVPVATPARAPRAPRRGRTRARRPAAPRHARAP